MLASPRARASSIEVEALCTDPVEHRRRDEERVIDILGIGVSEPDAIRQTR